MAEIVLLVTGSRSIQSLDLVAEAFDQFTYAWRMRFRENPKLKLIKHGAATGVDMLVDTLAKKLNIPTLPFPAKWNSWKGLSKEKIKIKTNRRGKQYNALAGFNRNQEMIDSGFDVLLAIRCLGKSNGTDHTIEQVKKTGKPIFLYKEDNTYEWLQ